MNTEHFILNLHKRKNLQLKIGRPSSISQLEDIEVKIKTKFPDPVKWFYQSCNGFEIVDPPLRVKSLSELTIDLRSRIEFAIFDEKHILCFDTTCINEAGQWNIVNSETGYLVTKTMPSFWSNKIFAWIDSRRTIWQAEYAC